MRKSTLSLTVVIAALASSGSAWAQTDPGNGLAGLLLRFFSTSNPVVLRDAQPFSHAAHFVSQASAQSTLRQLNTGIASQLSTFPLGSSSAGFTFTFDPALGVFNRSAESFGPTFAERAITAGKKKFSFGINYVHATYDKFDGIDLHDGSIQFYLTHLDTNNDHSHLSPWFEGDLIQSNLFLDLKSDSTVLFANYGVTDKLDVGVAVPYVHLNVTARIHASINRLATGVDPFVIHVFPDGTDSHDFLESGTADGIGDIVVRAKYNFMTRPSVAMAIGADVRLPTGKEEDLLGSGATQTKLYLVLQGPAKRFSPHANLGYTLSNGGSQFVGNLPDEINYTAGFDAALHRRVTLTAEFIGRTLRDTERLVADSTSYQFSQRLTPTVVQQTTLNQVDTRTGNVNLMLGQAGLKINPIGHLLISGSVLFSLGNAGLQDKFTPVVGFDYSF